MGAMHGEAPHQSGGAVEAEAATAALRVSLLVPQARVSEPVTIVVRVRSEPLGEPVTGAAVSVIVRAAGTEQAVVPAEESPQGGEYRVSHRFAEPGRHDVRAVVRVGGFLALTVEVAVPVAASGRGGPGIAPAAAFAGLVMVVMRAAMLTGGS
jgi:hypothetical protein